MKTETKIYVRKKTQTFMEGEGDTIKLVARYCIESRQTGDRKFQLTGDSNGIWKFATPEEQEAKILELRDQGCAECEHA